MKPLEQVVREVNPSRSSVAQQPNPAMTGEGVPRDYVRARTPANTSRAMSMLIDGNRNGLSNTFSKAETGNVLADLVTQLSEALFGPIDPKKKKTDQLKIR